MAYVNASALSTTRTHAAARARGLVAGCALADTHVTALVRLDRPAGIVSVEPLSYSRVRISFDAPMINDERLLNVENYRLYPEWVLMPAPAHRAAEIFYDEIEAERTTQPTFVDVILKTKMTNDGLYDCEIATENGPVNKYGSPFIEETNKAQFVGLAEAPQVFVVEAVGKNRVDVVCTERMLKNADIMSKENYVFDNGLEVIEVLGIDGDRIQLKTTDQEPGVLYTLLVSPSTP